MLQIKRVYDPPAKEDGARFLAERLLAARDEKGGVAHRRLVEERSAQRHSAPVVQPRPSQRQGGGNVERCYPSMDAIF